MFNFLKEFGIPGIAIGVLTLVVFLYKRAKELQVTKQKITKEQLDAMTELFDSSDRINNPFIVEQVFHFKFKSYIQYSVIQILLMLNNPTEAIQNYKFGKLHLEYDRDDNKIKYRKKMNNKKYRKKWKFIDVAFYFIFFICAGGLLFNLSWINENIGFPVMLMTILMMFTFLWAAYEFLMSAGRIAGAERLMEEIKRESHITKNSTRTLFSLAENKPMKKEPVN